MMRIKFTVVGDSKTGKTCWLSVLRGGEFRKFHRCGRLEPFVKRFVVNNTEYEVEIWDTIGSNRDSQDRLRIYRNTDVFLICFAENDTVSFKNVVTRWYPEVKNCRPNASTVLVCTKCDIRSKSIPKHEIAEVRKRWHFCHMGLCSAYTKYNVEQIFKDTINNLFEIPAPKKPCYYSLVPTCCRKENKEND